MDLQENNLIESLKSAVSEVFEGLAFAEFSDYDRLSEMPEIEGEFFQTSIEFFEPLGGKLDIICDQEFLVDTVDAILGGEFEELTEEQVSDTLNEILNTICGRFLTRFLSDEREFDFGIPEFKKLKGNEIAYEAAEDNIIIDFVFDTSHLFCVLRQFTYTD